MSSLRITCAAALALLLAACGESHTAGDGGPGGDDAATSGWAGAYLTPACGPADGPAWELTLYEAAAPECSADGSRRSLRFYIHEGTDRYFPIEPGETVTSDTSSGGFGNGTATLCPGGTPPCRTSPTWSITFDAFEAGSGASGTYTVTFEGGESESGSFEATWCSPMMILCG